MAGKLFVISAPSGCGKSTLVQELLATWNEPFPLKRVITYTTRASRPGECEGKDYYYIGIDEFRLKKGQGFFQEATEFCGNWYGSPAQVFDPLYRKETSYLFVIEREGARAVRHLPGVVLIWITPPSFAELTERLYKRDTDCIETIEQRLKKAHEELEQEQQEKMYKYQLVNGNFQQALGELKRLLVDEIQKV